MPSYTPKAFRPRSCHFTSPAVWFIIVTKSILYRLLSSRSRYRPLFSIGAQAIREPLKICHGRSQIIEFWIGRFGGRNFACRRQGATPRPDSDYAECPVLRFTSLMVSYSLKHQVYMRRCLPLWMIWADYTESRNRRLWKTDSKAFKRVVYKLWFAD